jgi:hypothetical protein
VRELYCREVTVESSNGIRNGSRLISVVLTDCFETRNRGLVERTSFIVDKATFHGTAKTYPLKL